MEHWDKKRDEAEKNVINVFVVQRVVEAALLEHARPNLPRSGTISVAVHASTMSLLYHESSAEEHSFELNHTQRYCRFSCSSSCWDLTVICGFRSLLSFDTIAFAEPAGSTTLSVRSLARSSSSSSTSQHNQSTKALRGRIENFVHIPSKAVDNWKQRSRFNGWQWGILTGSAICTLVLLVNCVLVVLGASSKTGYNKGIATIITGSADQVSRWSTSLHIMINVLSTLLLSASNYAMQVLTAPTHDECVRAHRQGKWLDVGILSMRNITSLTLRRKVLWLALCISSLPLHLL
jgi:hypothetical protein